MSLDGIDADSQKMLTMNSLDDQVTQVADDTEKAMLQARSTN